MVDNECQIMGILLHCAIGCHWLPLVLCIYGIPLCSPIIGYILHRKIQKFQKGEPFSTGGGYITINPSHTKVTYLRHTLAAYYNHTPHNNNGTHFCSIHNTHKHRFYLYVLKPYISIHMYYAIGYTIVIYNRLQQLRYICYIRNPLYV